LRSRRAIARDGYAAAAAVRVGRRASRVLGPTFERDDYDFDRYGIA